LVYFNIRVTLYLFNDTNQLTDACSKKPYSSLKPGQHSVERQYYTGVTTDKPDGKKMLSNYGRFQSVYDQSQNTNVTKGVHVVPDKSSNNMRKYEIKTHFKIVGYEYTHNPSLFNSTKMGRDLQRTGGSHKGSLSLSNVGAMCTQHVVPAAHWSSTYRNTTAESATRERLVSRRPLWSINRQAYSSSRGVYKTEFQETMGKFGHNPRNILNKDSEKQEIPVNELTMGTNKVTKHMPGYSGFLPNTDINTNAVKQSEGAECRRTFIK